MCQEPIEILMIDAFGKRPFPWQKAIITHLNLMNWPTSDIPPSPTFLCAPTGGGKSIACDYFAAGQGYISWCILPLLSLGADQVIKINKNSAHGYGAVHITLVRLKPRMGTLVFRWIFCPNPGFCFSRNGHPKILAQLLACSSQQFPIAADDDFSDDQTSSPLLCPYRCQQCNNTIILLFHTTNAFLVNFLINY
jgi:hypothetical protein